MVFFTISFRRWYFCLHTCQPERTRKKKKKKREHLSVAWGYKNLTILPKQCSRASRLQDRGGSPSHNHGSWKWRNKSWENPFPTSMIMGGWVFVPLVFGRVLWLNLCSSTSFNPFPYLRSIDSTANGLVGRINILVRKHQTCFNKLWYCWWKKSC